MKVKYLALKVTIGLVLFVMYPESILTHTLIRLVILVVIVAAFYRVILRKFPNTRIAVQ